VTLLVLQFTVIFLCLAAAEFSVRKGFTLESQQQGALEESLDHILKQILTPSPTTQWDLVASIYPTKSVFSKLGPEGLTKMMEMWLRMQIPVAKFLQEQWSLGVNSCAENNMMVPRRGSEVDSAGWNVVCGCWNNIVRFVRGLCVALDQEPPLLIKCMKLTAADQMKWAQAAGQAEQVDVRVFVNLAKKNVTPWNVVLNKIPISREDIIQACEEEHVDSNRWLGAPRERNTKESRTHSDMICGVPIVNDAFHMALLKCLGAYGYKPFNK